jgi:hypothetical protein
MLYPDSAPLVSAELGKSEATAPVIADVKEFNELVNGAVIDSAAVDDDSAGKLIIIYYYYYYYYLLLLFIIIIIIYYYLLLLKNKLLYNLQFIF